MKIEFGNNSNSIGIYAIKNIKNKKIYIGSTTNSFRKRLLSHRYDLMHNRHTNKKLQRSWNKYGKDSFICYIIEIVNDFNTVIDRENFYLEKLKSYINGYNILKYANSSLGYKHTKDTIKKLSIIRKGKPQHENTRLAIYNANKGKIKDREIVNRITQKLKGKKRTKEFSNKMSYITKGRRLNSKRKIYLLNEDYTIFKEFDTVEEASKKINKSESYIRNKCCNQKKHEKYIICYNYYPIINKRSIHQKKKIGEVDLNGNIIKSWISIRDICSFYRLSPKTVIKYINLGKINNKINNKIIYI